MPDLPEGAILDFVIMCRQCGMGGIASYSVSPFGSLTLTCNRCGRQEIKFGERDRVPELPLTLPAKKKTDASTPTIEKIVH